MQRPKIKVVTFGIPDTTVFPEEYRNGSIAVGVWPPVGVMPFVLDREGGLERLRTWAINNILLGFIEGDYDDAHLREEEEFVKIVSRDGAVLLDTFVRGDYYEPYSPTES